ncbi:MAG: hypothetical protein R6V54_14485 [Desulfobacteraceae bacterium]
MKFEPMDHKLNRESTLKADAMDDLDCFGEFDKHDRICSRHCGVSIRCAIETNENPKVDILDHIMEMEFCRLQ